MTKLKAILAKLKHIAFWQSENTPENNRSIRNAYGVLQFKELEKAMAEVLLIEFEE